MALNAEFLNGVLGKEDASLEDKIKLVLAEHEAETRGLVKKKEELLAQEVKLKDKFKEFEEAGKASEAKILELESELKKNSPEETKKYLENQMASKEKEWLAERDKILSERDVYKASHYKRMQDDAISEGVKDLSFIDGLKDGFVALVMSQNKFEPKEIDGKTLFVNEEMKQVKDVMHEFALSTAGKNFLKNPSSGGGANNSAPLQVGGNVIKRSVYDKMSAQEQRDFFKNNGKLID